MNNNETASKEQELQAIQNQQKAKQSAPAAVIDKKLNGPNRPST
jgi:hypothetical protein